MFLNDRGDNTDLKKRYETVSTQILRRSYHYDEIIILWCSRS